jgi:hypothetical protein
MIIKKTNNKLEKMTDLLFFIPNLNFKEKTGQKIDQ